MWQSRGKNVVRKMAGNCFPRAKLFRKNMEKITQRKNGIIRIYKKQSRVDEINIISHNTSTLFSIFILFSHSNCQQNCDHIGRWNTIIYQNLSVSASV